MTAHKIDIEELPEGWEPVAYRTPKKGEFYLDCHKNVYPCDGFLVMDYWVVKKKPRRIVLEYTGEIRNGYPVCLLIKEE